MTGSVYVNGNVETLSTTNGEDLRNDVMTTHTDQIITVPKTFTSIHVEGKFINF